MQWLIQSIGGFILNFIEFLTKKIGIKYTLISLIIPVYASIIIFLFAFASFAVLYFMKIWNLLREIFSKMFDYSSANGEFGGLSNQTIISSAMEFLHQCGLASAFNIAMTLFLSFLSAFFILQLYKVFLYVKNHVRQIIADLLNLMNR